MHADLPVPVPDAKGARPWWRELTGYHWFVFLVASLGWLFDCLDQQLFIIARNPAITALLPAGTPSPGPAHLVVQTLGAQGIAPAAPPLGPMVQTLVAVKLAQSNALAVAGTPPDVVKAWGGYATSIFILGWATGGLIFGAVGDRIGRARTLTLAVLLYSISTGLSAFSVGVIDFSMYRFVTGLGVGGVFGLAVALVADALPDRPRPHALGLLQSLSAAGNFTAGAIAILVGLLEVGTFQGGSSAWKYLFLIGALPAFLSVFIALRVKEPEKWVKAREEGRAAGVAFGSYASLFGTPRWRKAALLGMLLCVAGVVGLWGVGFFSPELVGDVIDKVLKAQNVPASELPGRRLMWTGINMVMQNLGSLLGMLAFTWAAHRYGRKPAFAVGFVAAFLSTVMFFKLLSQPWHIFVLSPIMGFCQLTVFAGFSIYLPELFPLRLRSTGTSFCYNVGRFLAASGPWTLGTLQLYLGAGATTEGKLEAFRSAACWLSLVYLVGLLALPFLPETKGRPLPE